MAADSDGDVIAVWRRSDGANSTTAQANVAITGPPRPVEGGNPGGGGNLGGPGGPGGSGGPGGTGGPGADTVAPALTLTARAPKLSKLIARGLPLTVTCSEACSVTTQLRIDGTTAKRYGLSKSKKAVVIGRATVRTVAGRRTAVTVKLTRRAQTKLKRAPRLRLTAIASATDAAGNRARNASRSVSVKG